MADAVFDTQSAPATPSAGSAVWWIDSTAKILCVKDDAGRIAARSRNASTANQTTFASDTYVTNSDILIPGFGLQVGSTVHWWASVSKTGAGVAAPVYQVRIGSARTTADTSRLSLTGPAQTAVIDIATLHIMLTVRAIGASGVIQGTAWWNHRGTAASSTIGAGFANDGSGHVEGTSAAFDTSTSGGLYMGLSINGGASASWTMTQCVGLADW